MFSDTIFSRLRVCLPYFFFFVLTFYFLFCCCFLCHQSINLDGIWCGSVSLHKVIVMFEEGIGVSTIFFGGGGRYENNEFMFSGQ